MSTAYTITTAENNYYLSNNLEIQHTDFDKLSQASTNSSEETGQLQNTKLKRSLCRNYVMYGYCPYGYKCQFAHGAEQLQCNTHQKNNYKTKICIAFLKKGYCSYGERCNYIHQTSMKKKSIKIKYENFGEIFRQQKFQRKAGTDKSPLLMLLNSDSKRAQSGIQQIFIPQNLDQNSLSDKYQHY